LFVADKVTDQQQSHHAYLLAAFEDTSAASNTADTAPRKFTDTVYFCDAAQLTVAVYPAADFSAAAAACPTAYSPCPYLTSRLSYRRLRRNVGNAAETARDAADRTGRKDHERQAPWPQAATMCSHDRTRHYHQYVAMAKAPSPPTRR